VAVASPSLPPKQETLVPVTDTEIKPISFNIPFVVFVQPLLSVTVTV
jgi:hypothetical protein